MAVNPCEEFFQKHAENDEKVKELQQIGDALNWEQLKASPFSPGIVEPGEALLRQVAHPTFFNDETGRIKPIWFDDVTSRGMSTDRESFASQEAIVSRAKERLDKWNADNPTKQARTLHSLGRLLVDDIRSLVFEECQAFGVYDTALEDNEAHADVCLVCASKAARSLRSKLYDMAEAIRVE